MVRIVKTPHLQHLFHHKNQWLNRTIFLKVRFNEIDTVESIMIFSHQSNINVNRSFNDVRIAWDIAIWQEKLLTLAIIGEIEALQLYDRYGGVLNEVNTFNPVVVVWLLQLVKDCLKPVLRL